MFSPDGTRIASCSRDHSILIWDVRQQKVIAAPLDVHTDWVWSVGFSPDGALLVSGSKDCTIRIWDVHTGTLIKGSLTGHTDAVYSVVFSPDGNRIVSGSGDKTIRIWDVQSGETVVGPLEGHSDSVWSISISPDGSRIASGSRDFTVRVWDSQTGAMIAGPFQGHFSPVFSVSFSPDGNRIMSGAQNGVVYMWEAHTGVMILNLAGANSAVTFVAFSPEGKRIVYGCGNGTVVVHSLIESPLKGEEVPEGTLEILAAGHMSNNEAFDQMMLHGCTDMRPTIDPEGYSDGPACAGGFGDVWKGRLIGGVEVAVKTWQFSFMAREDPKQLKHVMQEVCSRFRVKHENIQELLGVTMFQGRLGVVSPWMPYSGLQEYIQKSPDVDRYGLCIQVATGLSYLHSKGMVHGGLKAANILVSTDGTLKISNFNYSILAESATVISHTANLGGGSLRWMAPELLPSADDDLERAVKRTKQSDVYALGMTLLEIITDRVPYSECETDHAFLSHLRSGNDLDTDPTQPLPLVSLRTQTCLAQSSLPITHILSILDAPVDLPGFTGSRLVIVLSDSAESDLLSRLDECVESVCVVAACVVADSGVRVGKALGVVKKKRGTIRPNPGLVKQLESWCSRSNRGRTIHLDGHGPGPGALGLDVASGSLRESAGSEESGSESEWEEEGIAWPSPPNEKTLCAMVEMRDSEEKFVGLVERLVQVYLPKLPPVLTASATALLGRNAAMVLDLHRRIATELKANQASRVGLCHVLSSYAPELTSLHQEFSAGHSAAKALLNRAQAKDPVLWSQWERERADESGPEPDGSRPRSLEDLLIAPIQRVCRYHLLVAGLRDGTEEPHVTDAVLAMQAVAASVDEIVRVRADEDRTKVVLDRMDPIPNLPAGYLASLGPCLLIGTLDVIYYEAPTKPPLVTANSHSSQLTVTSSAASTSRPLHLPSYLANPKRPNTSPHSSGPAIWSCAKYTPNESAATATATAPATAAARLACHPAAAEQKVLRPHPNQVPLTGSGPNSTQSTLDEQPPTLGLGHVQVQPSDQVFPYGIRINFSRHVFELGASCEEERDIWVRELVAARVGNELVLASDKDKDRGRGVTRSKSAGAVAPSEDTSKALVRGWSDGASTRTREKSLERGALAVRERSKSRERGALSARDKSRERGGAFSDQRSREQSRDPDDRSTIRDDRSTTTTREDKPLPPHPPPEKPPPQRKKSTGVLVPQDGPVQIGNWIVQRLETVSTPSGSITAAPSSHARSPSESLGRNASEGTGSGIYANPHAPSSYSNPHSYSTPHAPTSYSNPHTPLHPSPTVPSSYSNPHTPATYSNPLSPPASSSSIHSSPPSSFPAERLLPHITGSSTWHTSSEGTGIGERLENVFLRPRYGHGHSHGYGYGYAAAAAPSPHPQGSYAQPGYVGPGGQASYAGPNGQPVYISPNGQYVGPGGGGYVGPTAYGLSRESSQSSSSSTYSTPSTVTPTSYPRSEAPSGYARSEAPSAYARSEAHSNYARSEANSSYARSEGHGGYVRSDASSTAVPLGYARSEAPSNYSRSEAPSNYAPSNYPRSDYAPSINAPSSSSSSTPYGSQVSTPAGHGPNFATSSYAPRFQTRSRANESTLAANVERAFGVAPANGVGADVHRTNSSSTDRSRSFPPSPVTTAQPTLPAPVQPAAPQQQPLAPQPFVRRPSNNTRDPVIMALSDVISSTCREARDRASVKRKPLWMTPEEASAAAEKERKRLRTG
ncbi:Tyrosine kinase family catalytic domain protein [Rhizoctonia solani]|uniref:Tyrosine kinase family catalytic domain protein n=1 Tax=Rhizoctonia solani TaxID=456999 RepID=A0A8H8SS69_9AGAM|nr:Tyrosine kinase family catalytic domain protein [Rhizoctonia solani]QRW16284.1 Tyrosine kinase family catalytic domain protein [Rhizoctonia solani]